MAMGEPRGVMPGVPWRLEMPDIGPGTAPQAPRAPRLDVLLHRARGGGSTRAAECDGEPIMAGARQRFRVPLAALTHRVFDHRRGSILQERSRHAAEAGHGRLVAGPNGAKVLPVGVRDIGIPAVPERQVKGLHRPGVLPKADLFIAPIHLGVLTRGGFDADLGLARARRSKGPDEALHKGIGARATVMGAPVSMDPGGPQPRGPEPPWFDQRSTGSELGGPCEAPVDGRPCRLHVRLDRPPIQAHQGIPSRGTGDSPGHSAMHRCRAACCPSG
jgi:hypothetical protein